MPANQYVFFALMVIVFQWYMGRFAIALENTEKHVWDIQMMMEDKCKK